MERMLVNFLTWQKKGVCFASCKRCWYQLFKCCTWGFSKSKITCYYSVFKWRAVFFAGSCKLEGLGNAVAGAIAGAYHVHVWPKNTKARILLQIMLRKAIALDRRFAWGRQDYHKTMGRPLFSSHMLDLSEEPIEENISICKDYLARMDKLGMSLEIELEYRGEEDGVDNSDVDKSLLYTQPEEVYWLTKSSVPFPPLNIAASFGNVYGVYKPVMQSWHQKLDNSQSIFVKKRPGTTVNFVFTVGQALQKKKLPKPLAMGRLKWILILTPSGQPGWYSAVWKENHDYLQGQIGNPEGAISLIKSIMTHVFGWEKPRNRWW